MARAPDTQALRALLDREGSTLLRLASDSIRHRLDTGRPLSVDRSGFSRDLMAPGAAFVTLTKDNELRGCIGSVEAWRPLAVDVAANAAAAAFEEPRFPPLEAAELAGLGLSVSVLTPIVEIAAHSEAEVLASLRVGEDGVVLRAGARRGLFLPQMWGVFPEPVQFMAQLRRKAGLPEDFWSDDVRVSRFAAVSVKSENYSLRD